jgi:hypothetical protein
MSVMVRKRCSWEGKSYHSFCINWRPIVKDPNQGWCRIDGVVKVKTLDVKGEIEWKEGGNDTGVE